MDNLFSGIAAIALSLLLLTGFARYGIRGLWRLYYRAFNALVETIVNGLPRTEVEPKIKPYPEPEKCRCATPGDPIAITASDTLDGQSYIARRVCSKCWNVHVPKPQPPRGRGAVTKAAEPVVLTREEQINRVLTLSTSMTIGNTVFGAQPVEEPVDRTWPVEVHDPDTGVHLGTVKVDPYERYKFLVEQHRRGDAEARVEIELLSGHLVELAHKR